MAAGLQLQTTCLPKLLNAGHLICRPLVPHSRSLTPSHATHCLQVALDMLEHEQSGAFEYVDVEPAG